MVMLTDAWWRVYSGSALSKSRIAWDSIFVLTFEYLVRGLYISYTEFTRYLNFPEMSRSNLTASCLNSAAFRVKCFYSFVDRGDVFTELN